MGDIFKEQIVKRKATAIDAAVKIGLILAVAAIFVISLMLVQGLSVLITFAAGFGAMYLISFRNVEYEYVFTNGELDVDIIYNQSRRKQLFSANVKDIEIMANAENKDQSGAFNSFETLLDFSSGETKPNTYFFMINYKNKRSQVIIEPNEMMLKAISGSVSRQRLFL
ncbi:MAG: DUF6106 family protein [Defluviitaleaceae bacterium]|nr:DUF6106 family protein [Defluviitaleaceae bacterium]